MSENTWTYKVNDRCYRLSHSMFIVLNKNGFDAALYEYMKPDDGTYEDTWNYSKKQIRQMTQNWPTRYPALIALSAETFEYSAISVDVIEGSLFLKLVGFFWSIVNKLKSNKN